MAARDPRHPAHRTEEVAASLTGVDLSGGASTVGRDAMTTGGDSIAKAYLGGFTPQMGSPATPPLVANYHRYRRALEADALAKGGLPSPAEVERHAHKKGLQKAVKRLRHGDPKDVAFAAGYAKYRAKGGTLAHLRWLKKCGK